MANTIAITNENSLVDRFIMLKFLLSGLDYPNHMKRDD